MAEKDGEMFMTSFNATPKTTEQHLIARNNKSVAYVTNNKKDSVRSFVLLKLTTDRHEASRGLFATAELLVTLHSPKILSLSCYFFEFLLPVLPHSHFVC